MNKPKPIKEVYVHFAYEPVRQITFTATPDAKQDFEKFGKIYTEGEKYSLFVSGHYDFQHVLQYIRSKE